MAEEDGLSPTHLCAMCQKWHSGEICPQFVLVKEQIDAGKEAWEAMRDVAPRESIRKKVDRAWGIEVETIRGKCYLCAKDGIWVADARRPLVCGPCQPIEEGIRYLMELKELEAQVAAAESEGMV